jgi:hypothetical protein
VVAPWRGRRHRGDRVGLPLKVRLTLPDGTRTRQWRVKPRAQRGGAPDRLRGGLGNRGAHSSRRGALARWVHVVDFGSVSNPLRDEERKSSDVLLHDGHTDLDRAHRRETYDRAVVFRAIQRRRHVAPDYLIGLMAGAGE